MSGAAVLTVNTGSSSIKLAAYRVEGNKPGERVLKASLSGLTTKRHFSAETPTDVVNEIPDTIEAAQGGLGKLVAALATWSAEALPEMDIQAIGHRVVHGGPALTGPARATPQVLSQLQSLSPLAPSHQPQNLAGVEGIGRLWPDIAQTLSFDTAFHRHQPRIAQLYAIPRHLSESGLLRFGFHGLSYAHIAETLQEILPPGRCGKVVAAHLGSGASLCAMADGQSVATTMGLTALDGVPMATRPGSVDPGLLLYLIQERGMSVQDVSDMLYKESGLRGLSGTSGDVRELLASDAPAAQEALEVYVYRIAREIGSLATALNGLDALVFTGGVGENSSRIRERVCAQLSWLGAGVDREANAAGRTLVQTPASRIAIAVVPADEESVIARETLSVLNPS